MGDKITGRKGTAPKLAARLSEITLDGETIAAGSMVTLTGHEGKFRFKYANAAGTEATLWGPCVIGMKNEAKEQAPWNAAQWRTVPVALIATVTTLAAVAAVAADKVAANGEVPYDQMSPGQKAAYTKRLKALQVAA